MEELVPRIRAVVRATEAYRRLCAAVLGIGLSETNLLAELQYNGPRTPSVLAERLGLTSASVTSVVDRLEALGLVARHRHPGDRRSVFVQLTATGSQELTVMVEMFTGDILQAVVGAEPEHIQELNRLLEHIATQLEARVAERSGIAKTLAPWATPHEHTSHAAIGDVPPATKDAVADRLDNAPSPPDD